MIKSIEGTFVTGKGVSKKLVKFDTKSGIITEVNEIDCKAPQKNSDYKYDCKNCLIFSGMGDVHIHAREDITGKKNYKEDFDSASNAAINGGVAFVCDMPNNPRPPIDDQTFTDKFKLASKTKIPFVLYAAIGPSSKPLSFSVPYKIYMGPSVGKDLFFKSNKKLDEALSLYQGMWVSFHCEDLEILEKMKMCDLHSERRPVEAEVKSIKHAIELIEKYDLKGKICHLSTEEGLSLITKAKKKGLFIQCEVTPQHVFFNSDDLKEKELKMMQMNPPIRSRSDQKALLKGLLNGEIDYLATDHAPHTKEEKERGVSGLTGLDTYGSFVSWLLVKKKMDPCLVAKIAVENPADFCNRFIDSLKRFEPRYHTFGEGVGKIAPGYMANFTVLNLETPLKVTKDSLKTKSKWSPFLDFNFPGNVDAVFIGGKKMI